MEKLAWQVPCWLGKVAGRHVPVSELDGTSGGQMQQHTVFVLFDPHGDLEQ